MADLFGSRETGAAAVAELRAECSAKEEEYSALVHTARTLERTHALAAEHRSEARRRRQEGWDKFSHHLQLELKVAVEQLQLKMKRIHHMRRETAHSEAELEAEASEAAAWRARALQRCGAGEGDGPEWAAAKAAACSDEASEGGTEEGGLLEHALVAARAAAAKEVAQLKARHRSEMVRGALFLQLLPPHHPRNPPIRDHPVSSPSRLPCCRPAFPQWRLKLSSPAGRAAAMAAAKSGIGKKAQSTSQGRSTATPPGDPPREALHASISSGATRKPVPKPVPPVPVPRQCLVAGSRSGSGSNAHHAPPPPTRLVTPELSTELLELPPSPRPPSLTGFICPECFMPLGSISDLQQHCTSGACSSGVVHEDPSDRV